MSNRNVFSLQGLDTSGASAVPNRAPAYSAADFHKVQAEIGTMMIDLQEMIPALTKTQKMQIQAMLGLGTSDNPSMVMDIDEVTAQYMLVLKVRDMVLDPQQRFHERTDAKGLTALVNAINGVINLFIRHQAKLDHMKEVSHMRESVVFAISELDPEVQQRFFEKLEELNNGQ